MGKYVPLVSFTHPLRASENVSIVFTGTASYSFMTYPDVGLKDDIESKFDKDSDAVVDELLVNFRFLFC